MAPTRRQLFRTAAAAGAGAVACSLPSGATESAATPATLPSNAAAMLYDATKCIGCKSCVVACRKANGMPVESSNGLWDDPIALSASTRNIIQVAKPAGDDGPWSFMKKQCMHCVDPACVNACMIGALQKRDYGDWSGVVTWDGDRCIGCRYCQVACPFGIPKFEWESATPRIVKCEMCSHLMAEGGGPACCEVCPTHAVVFGSRAELLAEAHRRIEEKPDLYRNHVYGETEAGGTQVLYLVSNEIEFRDVGLPELDEEPVPEMARSIQHGVYQGFVAPAALYALLGAVIWRNRRREADGDATHEGDA